MSYLVFIFWPARSNFSAFFAPYFLFWRAKRVDFRTKSL